MRLLSVSEDRHGDTAELIWEVEPGATVLDAVRLPSPTVSDAGRLLIDEPRALDAFLNAVRWGAITNADTHVLESPYRSGIEVIDYQLEPLVRAIDMPRIKMLIADDVGLGKTIEAGLIAQELDLRHRMRNCLVVCPAGLQSERATEDGVDRVTAESVGHYLRMHKTCRCQGRVELFLPAACSIPLGLAMAGEEDADRRSGGIPAQHVWDASQFRHS